MDAFNWELSWAGTSKVASHLPGPLSTYLPIILQSRLSFLAAWRLDPKNEYFKRTSLKVQALIKPLLASCLLMSLGPDHDVT